MVFILVLLIILLLFLVFMLFRNEWVCRKRLEFNNAVSEFRLNLIDQDYEKYKQLPDYNSFMNSIYSYNKMLLYFWVWDLNKLVINRELYNMIKGESK